MKGRTGMVGHLTRLRLQYSAIILLVARQQLNSIFSLDGVRSVWRNNPSQRGNVATATSTETNRLRNLVGESEVSRSETFVFWVLKRCGYTNTPATIFLIHGLSRVDKSIWRRRSSENKTFTEEGREEEGHTKGKAWQDYHAGSCSEWNAEAHWLPN